MLTILKGFSIAIADHKRVISQDVAMEGLDATTG